MRKTTLLTALLLLVAKPLFGFSGNADFQYGPDQTKARASMVTPHVKSTAMMIREKGSFSHACLNTTFSDSLFGGNACLTTKVDKKRNDDGELENEYHVSPAFSKGPVYFEPVWTSFNEKGKVTAITPFVQVNTKVKKMDLQTAGLYTFVPDGENSSAGYLAISNDRLGLGISKGYDDGLGMQFGAKGDKVGTLNVADYNPETGDWNFKGFLAEDGCGPLGSDGPAMYGDFVVVGRPPELEPYFTGIATKTKEGLIGKVNISGNKDNVNCVHGELGYNTGEGLSVSVGREHDFQNSTSTTGATMTYQDGDVTLEGKINSGGDFGLFASYDF